MVDKSKRRLFSRKGIAEEIGQIAANFSAGMDEAEKKERFDRFFESYEASYALTLAYPDEILLESARMAGIETEGRDKKEIVKEMMQKKGGY